jgi:hypothetical protein
LILKSKLSRIQEARKIQKLKEAAAKGVGSSTRKGKKIQLEVFNSNYFIVQK